MNEELRQQIQKSIKDIRAMRNTDAVVVACNIHDFAEVQETIEDPQVQVIAASYVNKGHVRVEGAKDFWIKNALESWEEKNKNEGISNKDDYDRLGIRSDYTRVHHRSITDPGRSNGD